MGTTVQWLGARQTRARKAPVRSANVFKGGQSLERTSWDGVDLVRLSVWPKGASQPPASYAVLPDVPEDEIDEFTAAGFDDSDFPEEEGDRRGKPAPQPGHAENEDFSGLISDTLRWEACPEGKLPFHLQWQQSAESRWNFYFDLPRDARCLGLGERLSGLNLRSAVHTLFNTDNVNHLETMDSMYESIPFLIIEHRGQFHGIFLDSPARQRWDLDSMLDGKASIELLSRRGWQLYSLGPSSLQKIVAAYTRLTGRSKMPPIWALGHHQSRWSYPDEETVIRLAHQFRSRKIPCDVIVLDIDYMDEYRVFTYSKERFANFKEMISDLSNNHFKVVTIVDPGVKRDSKYFVFNDGKKHSFFCRRADGKVFVADVWPGPSALPDFLRQDVRLWWAALHGFHTELGVAGIWNDMNEPALFKLQNPLPQEAEELPPEAKQLFLQSTAEGMVGHFEVRNLYGFQMSRATYEGLTAMRPNERPFVLSRAGYAGIQRYAAVWLGDNMSWWEHLRKSIPMLINMGLSGVPFCGVDVGGFGDDCSAELLVRWYALGIFYPFFRNHCSMRGLPQEPWMFSLEVEDQCRRLIQMRYRLLPYIQRLFAEHHRTGAPLIRPLSWHYQEDDLALDIDDQFMFGEDIMVAPILERARKTRSVYLPEGTWHRLEGGEVLDGGRLHQVTFQLGEVPAFVRDGAIIPFADAIENTSELEKSTISFVCFGQNGRGFYYEDDGSSFDYEEGRYNEWRIKVDDGQFVAQPVELGYDAPEREFKLVYNGAKTTVKLSP